MNRRLTIDRDSAPDGLVEILEEIIAEINSSIRIERWTNEEIDKKYAKRSVDQILEDGNVHYADPCLDLTYVALPLFEEKGLNPAFIIEELESRGSPFLHFALDFQYEGEPHSISFFQRRHVVLRKGRYETVRRTIVPLQSFRIDGSFDLSKSVLENLGGQAFLERFKEFDLENAITSLKRLNNDQEYEKYQRSLKSIEREYGTRELHLSFM